MISNEGLFMYYVLIIPLCQNVTPKELFVIKDEYSYKNVTSPRLIRSYLKKSLSREKGKN